MKYVNNWQAELAERLEQPGNRQQVNQYDYEAAGKDSELISKCFICRNVQNIEHFIN